MQWRTMFGNGLLAFSKYSDSSLHCMHCNITLILHILYYDLRIFHCHPGGHIAIEHNVSMTLININNMHRYYEWVSERVWESGTPVPRQHEHDQWVYISTTKLLIIIIIIINTMASTDGRQCLTHHSVITSHHSRLQNRRDETVSNGETRRRIRQNTLRRRGTMSSTLPQPCRPVQTERSCRRRLAIRRYPFRLNNIINCCTTRRSYPNSTSKSYSRKAYFTVAADWKLVRVVRRRHFDDDHWLGNSSRRWGKVYTRTVYIARSIVLEQVKSSATKRTVTNSSIPRNKRV